MDWFLYDNRLRHERVKTILKLVDYPQSYIKFFVFQVKTF